MLAVLRSDRNRKHSTFSLVHGTLHPIHANPLEVIVLLSLYLAVLDDQSKEEQFIDVFTFLEISFQKQKSAEESSRKNGKNPRRISFIVLALFRLCLFPLQKTSLHFSELSSTPASHLVPSGSLGMLLSSFSEVQRIRCSSP